MILCTITSNATPHLFSRGKSKTKQSKLMITRNNDKIVKREVSRDVRKFSYKKMLLKLISTNAMFDVP